MSISDGLSCSQNSNPTRSISFVLANLVPPKRALVKSASVRSAPVKSLPLRSVFTSFVGLG
jgi:hypothetical protein